MSNLDYKQILLALGVTNTVLSTGILSGISLYCNSLHPEPQDPKNSSINMTDFSQFKEIQDKNRKDCNDEMAIYALPVFFAVNMGVTTYLVLRKIGCFDSRRIGFENEDRDANPQANLVVVGIPSRGDNILPDTNTTRPSASSAQLQQALSTRYIV